MYMNRCTSRGIKRLIIGENSLYFVNLKAQDLQCEMRSGLVDILKVFLIVGDGVTIWKFLNRHCHSYSKRLAIFSK